MFWVPTSVAFRATLLPVSYKSFLLVPTSSIGCRICVSEVGKTLTVSIYSPLGGRRDILGVDLAARLRVSEFCDELLARLVSCDFLDLLSLRQRVELENGPSVGGLTAAAPRHHRVGRNVKSRPDPPELE